MSADMPKPVAYLTLDSLGHAATCTGPERAAYWRKCGYLVENIFTETQLLECAEAKCEELRAVMAQMAEALRYILPRTHDSFTRNMIGDAVRNYDKIGEHSEREPHQ